MNREQPAASQPQTSVLDVLGKSWNKLPPHTSVATDLETCAREIPGDKPREMGELAASPNDFQTHTQVHQAGEPGTI